MPTRDTLLRILRPALVATFVLGSIPAIAILVDEPAATAQQMPADKPDKPNEPRGDGCIPIGVTKSSTGAVYAEEECHGKRYHTKMN